MKNNNTHPCNQEQNHMHNCQEHVIKLWVDECTGKLIDPITVTDAVITKHGKLLTEVLEIIFQKLGENKTALNELKIKVEDLENYKNLFIALKTAFDQIKAQIDAGHFATKTDLECLRTQLYSLLESIKAQLQVNTNLFSQLLVYLSSGNSGGSGGGGSIDIDLSGYVKKTELGQYLKTINLTSAIRDLNRFAEGVKSELTGKLYPAETDALNESFGIVTLPVNIGGAFQIDDNSMGDSRFYFSISGDVNCDGHVTAADITALYNALVNNDYTHAIHWDQSVDGVLTAADVTVVYDVLLNGRSGSVTDKVTEKGFDLPAGTVFLNGNYIYYVKMDNSTSCIGVIPKLNQSLTSMYNVINIPPIPAIPQEQIIPEKAVVDEVTANMRKLANINKLVNVYAVAAQTVTSGKTYKQRILEVNDLITTNNFDVQITNYPVASYRVEWKGLPQESAQGIVFMGDTWNDHGISRELQRILPLGSFIDFKRFFATKPYIDISILDRELYKISLSRFEVIDPTTLDTNPFAGEEDYVILANYEPQNGIAYYFLWLGKRLLKPVLILKEYLNEYLNSIDY